MFQPKFSAHLLEPFYSDQQFRLLRTEALRGSELVLDLLERHSLGFGNHRFHPHELKYHHRGEERENVAGRKSRDHLRKKCSEQRGEHPVREAAEGLPLGAMLIREDLGNKYPNDGSLADRVGRNKSEDTDGDNRVVLSKESPCHQTERRNIAERPHEKKRATPESIDEPKSDKCKYQIRNPDADRLQQRCFRAKAGKFKNARRKVENRVDS